MKDAIQSALDQTFEDFEIVVSDNDDSDILTSKAVESFSDRRIRYYRTTGRLSMPDNWQNALSKSTGRYITILEDKQAFYPHALATIYTVMKNSGAHVAVWATDHIDDRFNRKILIKHHRSGTTTKIPSDTVLAEFVHLGGNTWKWLPRMINSCISRDALDMVAQNAGLGRFFIDICPDLCSAFMQLNYLDSIYYTDRALSVWGTLSESNAYKLMRKTPEHTSFTGLVDDQNKFFSHVPIKSPHLVNNIIVNDYNRLSELLGGRLSRFNISDRDYFMMTFQDLVVNLMLGADVRPEFTLWKRHLRTQREDVRKNIWFVCVKMFLVHFFKTQLKKHPTLANRVCRLGGLKTRLITKHSNILDFTRDPALQE